MVRAFTRVLFGGGVLSRGGAQVVRVSVSGWVSRVGKVGSEWAPVVMSQRVDCVMLWRGAGRFYSSERIGWRRAGGFDRSECHCLRVAGGFDSSECKCLMGGWWILWHYSNEGNCLKGACGFYSNECNCLMEGWWIL